MLNKDWPILNYFYLGSSLNIYGDISNTIKIYVLDNRHLLRKLVILCTRIFFYSFCIVVKMYFLKVCISSEQPILHCLYRKHSLIKIWKLKIDISVIYLIISAGSLAHWEITLSSNKVPRRGSMVLIRVGTKNPLHVIIQLVYLLTENLLLTEIASQLSEGLSEIFFG